MDLSPLKLPPYSIVLKCVVPLVQIMCGLNVLKNVLIKDVTIVYENGKKENMEDVMNMALKAGGDKFYEFTKGTMICWKHYETIDSDDEYESVRKKVKIDDEKKTKGGKNGKGKRDTGVS